MGKRITVKNSGGLEQFLYRTQNSTLKKYHNDRTCYEAYLELKKVLRPIQESVTEGAMAEGIRAVLKQYEEKLDSISSKNDSLSCTQEIRELFAADPVIFLNDHGPKHIDKVIERAGDMVMSFHGNDLSEFEVFILLCAIQIHDIGNVLGRAGHERKLVEIFDENCKNIIIDSPERRVIKSIAMAHGGKSSLGKDTISLLSKSEKIFNYTVKTRLLAAILRFADELADDSTRANRSALDLQIIGTNSEIYHRYSQALHTVEIEDNLENNDSRLSLVYELEIDAIKKTYKIGNIEKYLLDEIYDRTIKMELERRYCMKFMYQSINIGRIDIEINIYGKTSEKIKSITYTLEDVSYPSNPISGQIRYLLNKDVPSGEELLQQFAERGFINGD